jgi:hypothetical protein
MNSHENIKILLESMKNIATCLPLSEKESLYCKELYNEVKILCLQEVPTNDYQKQLSKSRAKMSENDAILGLKIRISNLIQSTL